MKLRHTILAIFSMIFIFISCDKENGNDPDLAIPECIQEIIDDPIRSLSLRTVEVQLYEGEHHYWMNADLNVADGLDYVLSNQCDTVGTYVSYSTDQNYVHDKWVKIWER